MRGSCDNYNMPIKVENVKGKLFLHRVLFFKLKNAIFQKYSKILSILDDVLYGKKIILGLFGFYAKNLWQNDASIH